MGGYSTRPFGYTTVCELSFPSDLEKGKLSSVSLFGCTTESNSNFVKGGEGD